MARKKAGNSAGSGALIIFALLLGALASIPKSAWVRLQYMVENGYNVGRVNSLPKHVRHSFEIITMR